MKTLLTIVLVAAVVVAGYFIFIKDGGRSPFGGGPREGQTDIGGKKLDSPSASENGTYQLDKKASSINLGSAGFIIKSGTFQIGSGDLTGGTIVASSNDLSKLAGFSAAGDEIRLEMKALVFERAKSTSDNLVYRTDAELTLNGRTNPVSFTSQFIYQTGSYMIIGSATPDWKLWGITPANGESVPMSISFTAVK